MGFLDTPCSGLPNFKFKVGSIIKMMVALLLQDIIGDD